MTVAAPDLEKTAPRSPRERMLGVAHLPRMLDKARAATAGTLGEYIYPCPMDRSLLAFLDLEPEPVRQAARTRGDEEMAAWVREHAADRTKEEKDAFSGELLSSEPGNEEQRAYFREQVADVMRRRPTLDPAAIRSWADLLDADEGRALPPAG